MSVKVVAPVWFDGSNTFRGGTLLGVSDDAVVVGIVAKPDGYFVPPFSNEVGQKNTLQVKDNDLGTLYLDLTLAEWQAMISPTVASPDKQLTFTYTMGADAPIGMYIQDAELIDFLANNIWVNGVEQDIRTVDYNVSTGRFTFPYMLNLDDVVAIIGHNE